MIREPRRPPSKYALLRGAWMPAVALAASALATLVPDVMAAQTAEDSAAVAARIDAYRTAWDTHDASAVAAFFTEDADFVMGNQPAAVGRPAIREWWSGYFSHQEPERHLVLDVGSIRFATADVAVVDVATTTGGRDRQGQDLLARRFRGTWFVHRQRGAWLISAMRGLPAEEDRVVLNASVAATEEIRPEIRAFVDAYEDAFNHHDPAAVSAFYGGDADIVVRNGPVTRGRRAIEAWWTSYFSQPRPYRAVLVLKDARMITPNVALINVIGTGLPDEPALRRAPTRYARATWLLARQEDGGWIITALRVLPSEDDQIIRGSGRRDPIREVE